MSLVLTPNAASAFEVIPSIDLLGGRVVRLARGDFAKVSDFGDASALLDRWELPERSRLHVVDLEASRRGADRESETIAKLLGRGLRVQIGGGIRSAADARRWIELGVERVVVGTVAARDPEELARIADTVGAERIVVAVDLGDGGVRTDGWEQAAVRSLDSILRDAERIGVSEILATDISRDGMLAGTSASFYRDLASRTRIPIIASGGVSSIADLVSLGRIEGLSGAVVGRALVEGRFTARAAMRRAAVSRFAVRVIPCLDVRGGRVVKGVRFRSLRDAGDPVEQARRYEAEGADELVILDVSATEEERGASIDTVGRVAESLYIPLTVGGGVRTVADFRRLLQAGADRVAINTAAVERPSILSETAEQFGVQAVVLACDAQRNGDRYRVITRSGTRAHALDAVAWCRDAERLGAGEVLLTSVDRDGTQAGFDLELTRAVSESIGISVIASGGAGTPKHFADVVVNAGASAVLAASLFHDRVLTIDDVKQALAAGSVPVRPRPKEMFP